MDMHEEQNLQNSDEVSNTDNSVEQNATTSKKKIQHKRHTVKKITSKIRKNDGPPPMVLNPVTPDLVTLKPARKKAKTCKRINSRKRKNGNSFVSETMQSNDSWLESTGTQNKDGKSSVRRKLNLNEKSKLSSENPSTHSSSSTSFSFLHKVYKRRKIDNMKSQNLYRHPELGFTPLCKEVEEKRCVVMPSSASMNFSFFTKVYKRRRIEREKNLPEICPVMNSTLETSQAKLTNKRFEIPVQAFDLDKLEPNDVCNQLMAISTPMKTTQHPRKHRESLADGQRALKRQELALVPYVNPLNTLEQKLDAKVNRNRSQKRISNRKNAFVTYGEASAMVPYKRQPNRYRPVVAFDPRNKWLWNCFASKEHIPDTGTFSDDTKRWWESERRVFQGCAESFLAKTRLILGNRRFSKWKGSVVDSVVGVFLTQNVSDLLSSSAFMNLAARFPLKSKENLHGFDSVKITSLVEKRALTMDEKSKCNEAPYETKEDESSLRNSVGPSISACKNCTQSSICSDIEDLIGNYSYRIPTKGPVAVDTQPDESLSKRKEPKSCGSILQNLKVLKLSKSHSKGIVQNKLNNSPNIMPNAKKLKTNKIVSKNIDWDKLRKEAYGNLPSKERSIDHIDSADWEAVSQADVDEIANAIRSRGQHNVLAARVKNFLTQVAKDHGSIDLEWLRNVSPDKAKEYLRSIEGLGLKSVDCVRLLGLHFKAFPVDTNIARIFVRLGWIPLQPLPESAQLHDIDKYPIMGTVQEYLWPRLWTLDQPTLYELHYQLITFGKVFCTKKNPNCNACPMKNECKHFASASGSAKRVATGPEERCSENSVYSSIPSIDSFTGSSPLAIAQLEDSQLSEKFNSTSCEPVIEEPPSHQHEPEPEHVEQYRVNYSDDCLCNSDEDDIIELNLKDASQDFKHINEANNIEPQDDGNSNLALIIAPFVSFPMPVLKNTDKFRTKHYA